MEHSIKLSLDEYNGLLERANRTDEEIESRVKEIVQNSKTFNVHLKLYERGFTGEDLAVVSLSGCGHEYTESLSKAIRDCANEQLAEVYGSFDDREEARVRIERLEKQVFKYKSLSFLVLLILAGMARFLAVSG